MEIVTPHDPEARYSQKVTPSGQREWIGYRDHQTEACGRASANVIVQVVTRPATEQDIDALDRIHQGIAAQDLQPTEHLVDGGYTSPDVGRLRQPTRPHTPKTHPLLQRLPATHTLKITNSISECPWS